MEKKYKNMYLESTTSPDIESSEFLKGTLFLNSLKREGEFQADNRENIIFDIKATDIFKTGGHFQIKITETDGTVWWFQETMTE